MDVIVAFIIGVIQHSGLIVKRFPFFSLAAGPTAVFLRYRRRRRKTITATLFNHGSPPLTSLRRSYYLNFTTEVVDANNILLGNLLDRIGGPEAENAGIDTGTFNVYDVQAKDKGSYSLLVQSAVQEQDYGQAVLALRTMTEAGLYPTNRHLNIWTEVSNKRRYSRAISRQYPIENGSADVITKRNVIAEPEQQSKI